MFGFNRLLLVTICSAFCASVVQASWQQHQFSAMGTLVELEVWQSDGMDVAKLYRVAEQEIARLERLMSPYIETSDVSRINEQAGRNSVEVSQDTYRVIERALNYSRESSGAFDVSYAAAGRHYDYRENQAPEREELDEAIRRIDYKNIVLEHRQTEEETSAFHIYLKSEGMAIDLGGIAKGYAVDQVTSLWKQQGVVSAAIGIGGDSRFIGDRGPVMGSSQRLPWMIGIKHPRSDRRDQYALKLPLVDTAFSTSGDYERYFIDDEGRRVHHILDPKTGRSVEDVVSVSVLGPLSMNCDALSTTLFVMGMEKGLLLIESLEQYDAVFIDARGSVHYSSGLQ